MLTNSALLEGELEEEGSRGPGVQIPRLGGTLFKVRPEPPSSPAHQILCKAHMVSPRPDNSRVFEAKGRKRHADKVSFTPEGPAVIVMHSVEEPEGGEHSQSG